jgi:hypothetical protein
MNVPTQVTRVAALLLLASREVSCAALRRTVLWNDGERAIPFVVGGVLTPADSERRAS